MADEAADNPRPFDVRTVRYLVALMSRHDLHEIDLREGALRIRLVRGGPGPIVAAPSVAPASVPAPTITPAPAAPVAKKLIEIKSPTPGTFYSKPTPESDTYVRAGARVTPNTVVCLIEAMKLFTEIQAECTGVISEILVENQQPVEYGQVLFRVDPAG